MGTSSYKRPYIAAITILSLIYLQEQGINDYAELKEKATAASNRFNDLTDRIKELDAGLTANAELQKQIVIYSKTRKTYVDYRKAGHSKKFKAQHEADIILHQAAKKYFNDLGYGRNNRLPAVAVLRSEYAVMLEEKKQCHRDYRKAKSDLGMYLSGISRAKVHTPLQENWAKKDINQCVRKNGVGLLLFRYLKM